MKAGGRRGGAGERVLESRHVIGLFLLMLVFSGVFFTLGYVMGRNQYDGQVRAASNPRTLQPTPVAPKLDRKEAVAKNTSGSRRESDPSTAPDAQPNTDWTFYNAGKSSGPEDTLKPVAPAARPVSTAIKTRPSKSSTTSSIPPGAYSLQVAALRRESDAVGLASHLRKKGFPAVVTPPQGDKYY